jgi:DNA segregation ATPase FtsK/SpoIIIE, S-DNA-T family
VTEPTQDQLKLILAFQQKMLGLGISARWSHTEDGPVLTVYYYKPDASLPVAKLLKHEEDFALVASVDAVNIARIGGYVAIFVPKPPTERRVVDFKDVAFHAYQHRNEYDVPLCLGIDHLGNKVILELTQQPHVLIGGQTGSGKSVFLKNIIANILICKSMSECVFSFIDIKRLDLPLFRECPQVLDVATCVKDAYEIFKNLLRECELRYKNLEIKRISSLHEWNERFPQNRYHYYVLVVDELAELLMQDKEFRDNSDNDTWLESEQIKPIHHYLQRLVQISRAAGIHMIAGTQRPSHKILSGDIKNNFPCRIGMKVPTYHDSMVILGEQGAECLLGKGDMLVKQGDSDVVKRYHGPFVRIDDINAIIHNLDYVRSSMEILK